MKNLFLYRVKLCLLFLSISVFVFANQEDMPIRDWLDGYGLLDENVLLIEWVERSPLVAATYVTGCRLESLFDQTAFDVYFNAAGILLDDRDLDRLGILPKTWNYLDAAFPAQVSNAPVPQTKSHVPFRQNLNAPVYVMEGLDHAALLSEDRRREAETSNSLIRYGVNRFLEPPIVLSGQFCSDGVMEVRENGDWQWEIHLQSTGALGIRVCFEQIQIPEGVLLFVYNVENPEERYGPYDSYETFWTPTMTGDGVGVVCYGSDIAALEKVSLEIHRIIHVYRSPLFNEKELQGCHVDIACRPEWEGHALAVGRLGMIDFDAWACSGSLIVAPGYSENPPFLLTANHCVSLQPQATTLEVWWLYQKDECSDELPPDMSTVPRSVGGATLLAGSSASAGSDFTLLLLKEGLPFAATFLGYTTRPISVEEAVVCIHHPQGAEKKISFGTISNAGSPRLDGEPLTSRDYFHEVLWTEGATEGGSSGSPLLLLNSGQLIGQLYGGYASCDAMDEPDYFGRIDVTWPLIAPWLNGEYPIEGELEGEAPEGEGEQPEGEGESEGEGEGEVIEGEPEGEEEGEGEGEPERCFFGLFPCPENSFGAQLLQYAEIGCKIVLSFLGLLLLRYLFFRPGM